MTETVDGVEKLRTPIAILKDLAKTYNSLSENDPLKSEITTNIGGKHHANQLSALLSGWADYEKMLVDYSNGAGSALEEANKSAIKSGAGFFDNILQSATKLIDTFDLLPVALAGTTAFLTAKNKNYGITKVFDTDTNKLSLEGNLFGIDFSQIQTFQRSRKCYCKMESKAS